MKLHLVDIDAALVRAWRTEFAPFPDVDIQHNDILSVAHHCVVSPANSHGFMDGGIDDQYRRFFGAQIEQTVQNAILKRPEQMLPVGASLLVPTNHTRIPWLIVAPTMEMPEAVPAHHSGRALRAVLRLVDHYQQLDSDIFCPGRVRSPDGWRQNWQPMRWPPLIHLGCSMHPPAASELVFVQASRILTLSSNFPPP